VLRERGAVTGITSASTIFVNASIAMTVGAGFPMTAIFVSIILLLALVLLGRLEDRVGLHTRVLTFTLAPPAGDSTMITRVHELVEQSQVRALR